MMEEDDSILEKLDEIKLKTSQGEIYNYWFPIFLN